MFKKTLTFSLLIITLLVSACVTTSITSKLDPITGKVTYRLKNFDQKGRAKLSLKSYDSSGVIFMCSLNAISYLESMASSPQFVFRVHKQGKVKEIRFKGGATGPTSSGNLSVHKNEYVLKLYSSNPSELAWSETFISKSQFAEIAQADKLELFIQTNGEPYQVIYYPDELKWFLAFYKQAL